MYSPKNRRPLLGKAPIAKVLGASKAPLGLWGLIMTNLTICLNIFPNFAVKYLINGLPDACGAL